MISFNASFSVATKGSSSTSLAEKKVGDSSGSSLVGVRISGEFWVSCDDCVFIIGILAAYYRRLDLRFTAMFNRSLKFVLRFPFLSASADCEGIDC